jgi:leucyl aminopeptidase (aminopeptidase T)
LYEELAKRVVRDALNVNSSDVVTVTTWDHTIDVANAMVVECFRRGADAMMSLWTDEYYYGMLRELSEESLGVCSKICEMFTETETATINMFGPKNPGGLKSLPNAKLNSWFEAERKAHYPRNVERKIRNVNLPFALVTPERAKVYGFDFGKWKRAVDDALTQDLTKLKEKGRRFASVLNSARTVRLKAPKGTDMVFELGRRPVHVDDGIIDDEDIEKKSLDAQLPAGSVLTTIPETSGRGRVVSDRPLQSMGLNVEGIEWEFKDGKVTSMKARKNTEVISKQFDAASGDKDRIGWLVIGLNAKAEYGYLMDNIVEGAVQIGIGDNEYIGGKNTASFGMPATLSKATLEIDGKVIVKDGRLLSE